MESNLHCWAVQILAFCHISCLVAFIFLLFILSFLHYQFHIVCYLYSILHACMSFSKINCRQMVEKATRHYVFESTKVYCRQNINYIFCMQVWDGRWVWCNILQGYYLLAVVASLFFWSSFCSVEFHMNRHSGNIACRFNVAYTKTHHWT